MGAHVRIVVDRPVNRSVPDLEQALSRRDRTSMLGVFDSDASLEKMIQVVRHFRPEIVVVDAGWLSAAALLGRILVLGGNAQARAVIGCSKWSEALDIRARRLGFFDVVDLAELSAGDMAERLTEICRGSSRLWGDSDDPGESVSGDIRVVDSLGDDLDVEIVELLALGLSDREISDGVHLSLQAVRNRVSGMLDRSGCANRTHLGWAYTSAKTVELICPASSP